MKICAGASAGGHMNQLLKLLEYSKSWSKQPDFFVTTLKTVARRLESYGTVYIIGEANRQHPFRAVLVLWKAFLIAIKERPDIVITTGSMPLAFFCFHAKLFGAKIVWIDSIANIDKLSVSGRFVHKFADLFLTQWQDLAAPERGVEYAGELL
jgi:UDP-N-acetylglucosamine:LPS N-acetylglucosamine transferase